jgi:hypothetical protein
MASSTRVAASPSEGTVRVIVRPADAAGCFRTPRFAGGLFTVRRGAAFFTVRCGAAFVRCVAGFITARVAAGPASVRCLARAPESGREALALLVTGRC